MEWLLQQAAVRDSPAGGETPGEESFVAEGYDDPSVLESMEESDLEEAMNDVKMTKEDHRRKLMHWSKGLAVTGEMRA